MTEILALNTGSSSVKFGLYRGEAEVLRGQIRNFPSAPVLAIGGEKRPVPGVTTIGDAVALIAELCREAEPRATIGAVGHRVVHGGAVFGGPAVITDEVLATIESLAPLAPSHQPSAIAGIGAAREAYPAAVQVASFDTAFHAGQEPHVTLYALPRRLAARGIRRYGFHGLAYDDVSERVSAAMGGEPRIVAAHLGSGASLCAIRGRTSVATSMGFTALDGLPMATRCGSVDPGVLLHLLRAEGMSAAALEAMLYREAGLLGLSGRSGHMAELLKHEDDPLTAEAIRYFCHRVRIGIGEMAAALGGIDALAFSGGIGENSPEIRERITNGLGFLGICVDPALNASGAPVISPDDAPLRVFVVNTDEEAVIRRQIAALGVA